MLYDNAGPSELERCFATHIARVIFFGASFVHRECAGIHRDNKAEQDDDF